MIERGDALIELLQSGVEDDSANELLKLVFAGYPIENLRRLIHSDEPIAVKSGAWIVSELGHRSVVMMGEVAWLLGHPLREGRFWALDAVLAGATTDHAETIAKAAALIADPDEAVRWKVLRLLARIPLGHLVASLPYFPDTHLFQLVTWFTSMDTEPNSLQEVLGRLSSTDRLTRMVAVAAAARLASQSPDALEQAAASEDQEVSSFARDELGARRVH
jgi:hypothetical protein